MISTRSRSFAEFSKSDKFRAASHSIGHQFYHPYFNSLVSTHQLTVPLYLKKLIMHADTILVMQCVTKFSACFMIFTIFVRKIFLSYYLLVESHCYTLLMKTDFKMFIGSEQQHIMQALNNEFKRLRDLLKLQLCGRVVKQL
ncbi:hypothetical protein T01_6678 [Trichinella spiralis]|uniref:Uncharacterized protein n=1 Tax=Trichinella spiralis TaxID=6334 RepID=A0A0V1BA56_TRISP|nr:hypothetical protein T01_6678 [Trichinella spiralis]